MPLKLENLSLWRNQISDISALLGLTQLINLELSNNPISPQDINWLKEELSNTDIIFNYASRRTELSNALYL